MVADVKKWIVDVESCLNQSSSHVDGIDGLQYELRESQVGLFSLFIFIIIIIMSHGMVWYSRV